MTTSAPFGHTSCVLFSSWTDLGISASSSACRLSRMSASSGRSADPRPDEEHHREPGGHYDLSGGHEHPQPERDVVVAVVEPVGEAGDGEDRGDGRGPPRPAPGEPHQPLTEPPAAELSDE